MGENIVVTGATSGIGLELAKNLILQGHTVYAVGRNFEKFSSTIYQWALFNGFNNSVNWIYCDFSRPTTNFEDEVVKIPIISGFVNCAGVLPVAPLKLQNVEDIVEAININLVSPILFTRALLKNKRISNNAAIVFISSINGVKVGSKAHSIYSASKAGIVGLVMSLANELANLGIRVNSISPGTVESPMYEKTKMLLGEEQFTNYLAKYPLGIGTANSLIPLINFLLNKKSSGWITGQNFVIDGGFTLN